jgi:hypothetical protein
MARKKFAEILNCETGRTAKLYYNSDLAEYDVVFYLGTVKQEDATYFTNDRLDALGTADHWTAQRTDSTPN